MRARAYKPRGFQALIPYIVVKDYTKLLDFLKSLVEVETLDLNLSPEQKLIHGEIRIDDSVIMLSDASQENNITQSQFCVYVTNVDEVYQKARSNQFQIIEDIQTHFYGDRSFKVKDPFNNLWVFATHLEDLSPDELDHRHIQ